MAEETSLSQADSDQTFKIDRMGKFRRPIRYRPGKSYSANNDKTNVVRNLEATEDLSQNHAVNHDTRKEIQSISRQLLYECDEMMIDYFMDGDYIARQLQEVKLQCRRDIMTEFGNTFANVIHHMENKTKQSVSRTPLIENKTIIRAFKRT
ncbi:hypothetical protein TrispH2_006133 [Trichoplax sp. H2]|nr:hypothetical protein TrispH2_006133 [Trichoplax sp. H2]|eukprot:RDD41724.1 hypothetical protein TrispH2_006133 [Trichoplax sp. H2]